jgi:hypothetical protein
MAESAVQNACLNWTVEMLLMMLDGGKRLCIDLHERKQDKEEFKT